MKLPEKLEIIDIHAHLGSYFEFPIRRGTAEEVIHKADELGITRLCASHMLSFRYDVHDGNTLTIQAAHRFPERILVGGVLDPRLSEAELEAEFKRCNPEVTMWNELHPALHRYPIHGTGYRKILELIESDPKPVLFHTDESDIFSRPELLLDHLQRFRTIPFVIGHSGNVLGGFEKAMDLAKKFDHVFLDTAFSRNYWGLMERMVKTVGAEKILFGSDIPFLNASAQVGKLLIANLTDSERQMIFHDNAAKLLRIPTSQ